MFLDGILKKCPLSWCLLNDVQAALEDVNTCSKVQLCNDTTSHAAKIEAQFHWVVFVQVHATFNRVRWAIPSQVQWKSLDINSDGWTAVGGNGPLLMRSLMLFWCPIFRPFRCLEKYCKHWHDAKPWSWHWLCQVRPPVRLSIRSISDLSTLLI